MSELLLLLVAFLTSFAFGFESDGEPVTSASSSAPAAAATPAAAPPPVLTPRQKAALLVVSGLPAPRGIGGVIVRAGEGSAARPTGALAVVDQEGGEVRAFGSEPPALPARAYSSGREAFGAGRATGRALRAHGLQVDLAPVLDAAGGPLGSRQFVRPAFGLAFARGLAAAGTGACVKHFPGLGTAAVTTDESPHVHARLTGAELAAFRAAVHAGVPCVMVGHAFYPRFGARRASFSPRAYRLLRSMGFDGVALTDSVSVFGSDYAVSSALRAVRAGADLVLYTNGRDAARAVAALVPLARSGVLDVHVRRVLRLRRELGLEHP